MRLSMKPRTWAKSASRSLSGISSFSFLSDDANTYLLRS